MLQTSFYKPASAELECSTQCAGCISKRVEGAGGGSSNAMLPCCFGICAADTEYLIARNLQRKDVL